MRDDLLVSLYVGHLLDERDASAYAAEHAFELGETDIPFRPPLPVGGYSNAEVVLVLRHLLGVKMPLELPTMLPLPLPGVSTKV